MSAKFSEGGGGGGSRTFFSSKSITWWGFCATHLLCCLKQTCLVFRPDFFSSSSRFSFHSGHMCLEDFLESATRLRISQLPLFWTWGEFGFDLGRHINHHVPHKELMLQSNLLSKNRLHIHNKFAQALSK